MLACGALDPPPLGTLGETVHQTVWGRINYTAIGLSLHPRPRHIPREAVLGDMAGCVCWGWSLESGGKALGLRHSHSEDRGGTGHAPCPPALAHWRESTLRSQRWGS